jgi:hypothetical protein
MKRLFLFAAISISVSAFAQHPTDKGWRSVGGTGNLHFDLDGSDGINHNFQLAPEVYWFVANSFGLGADFGFSMYANKADQGDTITVRSQSMNMWVAPGFHFYFREPEKAWRPYVFLNAGFQYSGGHYSTKYENNPSANTSGSTSTKGFRGYTGAGVAWFFSDHAAFDVRMRVIDLYPQRNASNQTEMEVNYSPSFSIGVQAFFD